MTILITRLVAILHHHLICHSHPGQAQLKTSYKATVVKKPTKIKVSYDSICKISHPKLYVFLILSVAGIPEYTKIIKKLTPIDENRIYGKPIEKRPQLLQLPQEEYVAMHSASTTNTGSTRPSPQFDFPVVTNYIEMRSATTTPLTERPESSYVVMRSASISSSEVKSPTNPPPLPGCYGNKSPTVPSRSLLMEESQEESHVNEDVFLKNKDYIDMKLTS